MIQYMCCWYKYAAWAVTAVANCCVFPEGSINDIITITSEYQLNNQVVTVCPYGSSLTGCQVNIQSETTNNIRGSYPGPQQGVNTAQHKLVQMELIQKINVLLKHDHQQQIF